MKNSRLPTKTPNTIWCLRFEIIPGKTRGEKLLEALFKSIMTIEKLKTIMEMSPPINVARINLAVAISLISNPGILFSR